MNRLAKCTHPVPPNQFGITAMHCPDNVPISPRNLKKVIDGPIEAVEPTYQAGLAKSVVLNPEDAAWLKAWLRQ